MTVSIVGVRSLRVSRPAKPQDVEQKVRLRNSFPEKLPKMESRHRLVAELLARMQVNRC